MHYLLWTHTCADIQGAIDSNKRSGDCLSYAEERQREVRRDREWGRALALPVKTVHELIVPIRKTGFTRLIERTIFLFLKAMIKLQCLQIRK